MKTKKFDAIIIGSGQGGSPLARALAKAGWKTAIIEKAFAGGTCINYGCTPTKTMISCAKTAYNVQHAKEWGVAVKDYTIDINAVMDFKERIVLESRNGQHDDLSQTKNLDYIEGTASFTGVKELKVELNDGSEQNITADKIFIDTGTSPTLPDIKGLNEINYLTSQTLLELREIPESLLIVGASYIALELGQMYKRFGSKVTILEKGKDFLPKEDRDIAECVEGFLKEEDIVVHTNTEVESVKKSGNKISVVIKDGDKESTIECTHILIAAGRIPNTKELQLDTTNVETDERGFIKVNDQLETSTPGIYALGDVNGGPQFTHISFNDYVLLRDFLLKNQSFSTNERQVPYCMFTDPQLSHVGLTEEQAKKKGLKFEVTSLSMDHVSRARETNHTKGLMKAIVDKKTKMILGATVVGEEGGETLAVLQMAMLGNIPYTKLAYMIIAHPTYAESINNLFSPLMK